MQRECKRCSIERYGLQAPIMMEHSHLAVPRWMLKVGIAVAVTGMVIIGMLTWLSH
jgi:hypothetical protein